jgi:hypothetical protein
MNSKIVKIFCIRKIFFIRWIVFPSPDSCAILEWLLLDGVEIFNSKLDGLDKRCECANCGELHKERM